MKSLVLGVALVTGCAAQTTQMEPCTDCGKKADQAENRPKPPDKLKQQSAFDLQCDQAQLQFTPMGGEHWYTDVRAWGVRGCGKQASYALQESCRGMAAEVCNWYINSPVQKTQ